MSVIEFTPGPWRVLEPRLQCFEIAGPNGEDLGYFNCSDGLDEPTDYPARENAQIAAAGPCMIEALQECKRYIEKHFEANNDDQCRAYQAIDAALAKALGETP